MTYEGNRYYSLPTILGIVFVAISLLISAAVASCGCVPAGTAQIVQTTETALEDCRTQARTAADDGEDAGRSARAWAAYDACKDAGGL